MSSTSALYTGAEECLDVRYLNEIGTFACKYGYDDSLESLEEKLDADLKTAAGEHGAKIRNNKTYYKWFISGHFPYSQRCRFLQGHIKCILQDCFVEFTVPGTNV